MVLNNEIYVFKTNKETITIRRFDPSDPISEITSLLHRSYKHLADMGLRFFATHQNDADTLKRLNDGIGYIGFHNNKIISTISLYNNDKAEYNSNWYNKKGVVHFGQFGVMPEFQKKGLGNFMMNIVEERAKKEGALEIALDTAEGAVHLIEYYKKRKYRFIEYADWKDTNYISVIMSKVLAEKKF